MNRVQFKMMPEFFNVALLLHDVVGKSSTLVNSQSQDAFYYTQ